MTVARLIAYLNSLGIRVWLEDGQLRYQAPKGAMTAEVRAEIVARKTALMDFLRQAQQTAEQPIPSAQRPAMIPLSFTQEQLWFQSQLEGSSATYNTPSRIRLQGMLDVSALERSLQEINRRHEVLRTSFHQANGQIYQKIASANFTLTQVVLGGGAEDAQDTHQEERLQQLIQAEAGRPFDLTAGTLWRATLVQLSTQEHILVLTFHHIAFDGWSMGVFNHELSVLYESYRNGQSSALPETPIQYADYAIWQQGEWVEQVQDQQVAYWQAQLQGALTQLPLPTDYPRPAQQSFRGENHAFAIPETVMRQLKHLSQEMDVTLFMTMQAAYAALLYRYTGQEDILIGSPIANRQRAELASLIGYFSNLLVFRNNLSSSVEADNSLTFRQLLKRVRPMAQDAYAHQEIPFELLVNALKIERTLSHHQLFQTLFSIEGRTQEQSLVLAGLTVTFLDADVPVAKCDLALMVHEDEDAYIGNWEYSTDLFAPATIERMTDHWLTLLASIAANPDGVIATLPMLTAAERQQIVHDWNDTATSYPDDKCFHHLFEEQAERTPDALAVVFDAATESEPITLTYRVLNERANQLAHYLRAQGVGPEVLVGLCVERSAEMIVALLAILKAGGAYVPLDPAYPQERLAFMMTDSGVSLIVTQEKFVATLPSVPSTLLCLDTTDLDAQPTVNPDVEMTPENLAYIIYTSGSTGTPKGVLIEHRGLCNTTETQVQAFGLGPQDRHLLFFSLSFDGCTADVILALRVGAALYMAPQQEILPGPPLHDFLQRHEITSLILTPTALAPVPATDLLNLHTVIVAGETCSADLVARWLPNRRFMNLYGATEASIFSTVAHCTDDGSVPSVGRPLVNNQLYVLDAHLQPVSVGVPGEIYLGGVGVARGYHNRPDLNRERFIDNPFSAGRLYKTGDLGRFRHDGEIEFIGRADNQIKVRGFRIELDEIETILAQHPSVREAAVVTRESEDGVKQLDAYVVTTEPTDATMLREYLAKTLPDYMVPSTMTMLDVLPLTVNGKLDRKALPEPMSQMQYVAPQNEIQRQLTTVWQGLLKVEQIGVHDNFFDLGGHSLLIAQLHTELQTIYDQEIDVTDLFQYPTVSTFATHLQKTIVQRSETKTTADRQQERAKARQYRQQKRQQRRQQRQKAQN
ncbi:MAG: amino acid adenylation domain-containing protein [Chloroflexota bacterium]